MSFFNTFFNPRNLFAQTIGLLVASFVLTMEAHHGSLILFVALCALGVMLITANMRTKFQNIRMVVYLASWCIGIIAAACEANNYHTLALACGIVAVMWLIAVATLRVFRA